MGSDGNGGEKGSGNANQDNDVLFRQIMNGTGAYKNGPPEGAYERENLEKLTTKQLRRVVKKHELEQTSEMSKGALIALLLDPESILHTHETGKKWGGWKIGCTIFFGLWVIFGLAMGYYVNFTDAGQESAAKFQAEKKVKDAAALAASTIDNAEMTAFCDKVRDFNSRHSAVRNRLKQGKVFAEFQNWFKGTMQAKLSAFSKVRAKVVRISASKGASKAGVSFNFCISGSNWSVTFGMWENGINEGTGVYNSLAELARGSEVLLSGKLRYKGFKSPTLSDTVSDSWRVKLGEAYWDFVFDVGDSEDDEEEVLEDFWFELSLDSVEPAPAAVQAPK
jgi:hypothetical protein